VAPVTEFPVPKFIELWLFFIPVWFLDELAETLTTFFFLVDEFWQRELLVFVKT
jgi:hypothetical protein